MPMFEWDEQLKMYRSSNPMRWRMLCADCEQHISDESEDEPTVCPICSGENISDIVEQVPWSSDISPDGNIWDYFTTDSGTIIIARRPTI